RRPHSACAGAAKDQVILRGHFGLPIRLYHHRLVRLDDQGWSHDGVARVAVVAREHRGIVPDATGEKRGGDFRYRQRINRQRQIRLVRIIAAAKSLDLDRLDLDRLVRADEAKALAMHRLEPVLEYSA